MKRRLLKKIAKKYGDSWWERVEEVIKDSPVISYYWRPPKRWDTKRMQDEFHRQRRDRYSGVYVYKVLIEPGDLPIN